MTARILRRIWGIWISICVAALILVVIEGLARVAFGEEVEGRPGMEGPFGRADWAREYLLEFSELRAEWHPYVYWRMRPHRGKYINVDVAGVRNARSSSPAPSPGQTKIFMFGGSSLWGIGARDEFTIPSLVSKKLAAKSPPAFWVTNLAEIGWVNTQEVIALMLELRRGNIPNIVVFYDGNNDSFSAFQSGVAGIPHNESNRIMEFNLLGNGDLRPVIIRRLGLYRVARQAVRSVRGFRMEGRPGADTGQVEPLAKATAEVYLRNVGLVQALSARYGFKVFFFWQPTLYRKKNLSEEERQILALPKISRMAPFFGRVQNALSEELRSGKFPSVHDISDVFENDGRTAFIDAVHMLEAGNERVADAIVKVLRDANQSAGR